MGYDLTTLARPPLSEEEVRGIVDGIPTKGRDPTEIVQEGYDALAATGCYFRFNYVAWPKALELARHNGWIPEHEPEYYRRNENNIVSAQDAEALASALERALDGLAKVTPAQPSHDYQDSMFGHQLPADTKSFGPREDLSAHAFWSDNPDKLRRFIVFARQGAFRVS